jgi:hypothetical protein
MDTLILLKLKTKDRKMYLKIIRYNEAKTNFPTSGISKKIMSEC